MPHSESNPRRARGGLVAAAAVVAVLVSAFGRPAPTRAAPPAAPDSGRFGRAIKADEVYAAAPHNPVYSVVPLTVEFWAKVGGKADLNMLVANEPRNSRSHWEIYADKGTGALCVAMPGFDFKTLKSKRDVADGKWHYAAMTYDGTTLRLHVDGEEAASTPAKRVGPYPDTGPLTFGFADGTPGDGSVAIDEVRVSRVVRPVDKVPDAPFKPDADTIGLWHLDETPKEGAETTFADASTTRNAATLRYKADGLPSTGGFDATRAVGGKTRWSNMDVGPFFSSTLGLPGDKANVTPKAISVRLGKDGKHGAAFDTETLRLVGGWSGDFVNIYPGREGLARHPDAAGKVLFSTKAGPGWSNPAGFADEFDDPRKDKLGPLPARWAKYRGIYVHGDRTVFAYSVGETEVLDRKSVV